jgi:hypothetical protein
MQLLPLGLATPLNLFNSLAKLTHNAGFKTPEEFWTNPATQPPQKPPGPPPEMQVEMAKLEDSKQRTQAEMVMQQHKLQAQAQSDAQKAQVDAMLKEQQLALDRYKAELAAQTDKEITVMKLASEAELERMRMMVQQQQQQRTEGQAKEKANGQQSALSAVVREIQNINNEIQSSKPEVIVPIRDASGRIIGGKIQTAGGESREIRIQ